jgi:hypothetical protein
MKRLLLVSFLALSLSCAQAKPVYEYKTLDETNEPRLETTAGCNQVMAEMVKDGWQLKDPKMAMPGMIQVWIREKK